MELRFRCAFLSFYIKAEVPLIYVPLNANDRRAQFASAGHYEPQTIMLGDRRSRQDGDGGPKGPCSFHDYPQTNGNVGTTAN